MTDKTDKKPASPPLMEKIVALCKRRGFIFQSSEIYGGINGFWDYGPLGAELKKNIRDGWWNDMVRGRDDVVGIETSIIMHPKVWEASGHVGGFTDPMVDCKSSKQRFRADEIYFSPVVVDGKIVQVSMLESVQTAADLQEKAETFKRKKAIQGKLEPVQPRDFTTATPEEIPLVPSPATGEPGSLTPARNFNMMFETYVGALREESEKTYLRPETAQGMFADFKAVLDTGRVKIPFGIAQIGKSFRNEITPRNFHLPQSRVRADGDGVLYQRRRRLGEMASVLDRLVPQLAAFHRAPRLEHFGVQPREGEARLLFKRYDRPHVPLSVRCAGIVGHRRPRLL